MFHCRHVKKRDSSATAFHFQYCILCIIGIIAGASSTDINIAKYHLRSGTSKRR
jgi:hypothetical protein